MDENEPIKDCYRKLYQGMVDKDAALMDSVLDDSSVLIHMTGMRQSKKEFIDNVLDGTLNYYGVTHEDISVKREGNMAKLVGKSVVDAAVFGGGKRRWRLKIVMELTFNGQGWKIVESRVSTY